MYFQGNRFHVIAFRLFLMSVLAFCVSSAFAQSGRINDKDMERLMKNLSEDAKSFRSSFNAAVKKSTIRKTSREKDARDLVARFEKETEGMLRTFKRTKQGDATVPLVLRTASQVEHLVYGLHLEGQTTSKWDRVHSELRQVSQGFGITEPGALLRHPAHAHSTGPEEARRIITTW